MRLYNTASKQLTELEPLNPPKVTIYTCGPTVYDYPHIGNWFTFIRYDLLIRALKINGYSPDWVMNITDVGHLVSDGDEGEDKLAKGAAREGKTAWEIARFYSDYFIEGLRRLNITTPNHLPRATQHIEDQIEFIKRLEDKGYTYATSDGIYFDTAKLADYGKLAKLNLDQSLTENRIEANLEKKLPQDFALWKKSPSNQKRDMEWDSPWGMGFPGWHIECSAMCYRYLGPTIDIHSGGIDHIPVHHTNEIAQSEAANKAPLANIWLHTNHVLINDTKISKSLANGLTLEDIEKQGHSLEALRLLVLESHYRSQSKFSWEALEAAGNRLLRYYNFAALGHQLEAGEPATNLPDIKTAIADDLNTPSALLQLESWLDAIDGKLDSKQTILKTCDLIDQAFGLNLSSAPEISQQAKDLILKRNDARKDKDWELADQLRKQIADLGVGIDDLPNGTSRWHYLSLESASRR